MSGEIEDLYVVLTAQTAPLTEGLLQAGVKGEELAVTFEQTSIAVEASVARMAAASKASLEGIARSSVVTGDEFLALAHQTAMASAQMEAATARAGASAEAMGAKIDAAAGESKMKSLQTGLFVGAAAFDFLAYESIKAAANFESSTTRLVTSAGETKSNLAGVRQGILDMAGAVGDSAGQLSQAMYVIESGGQHGADGLLVLRAAAEGAKAENADLTVVADAVTSVLQDYHLKASDAATVTSKLVAAVGAGKTNFQELSGSLHSVLPLASSMHISLDDVAGALASMTVHGMSADQAAQNLNDTIKHMAAPTSVQVKELGQLGISASDLSGMLGTKGITGTLQTLSETILQHMGPSGRVLLDAFNKSKDAANDANIMVSKMPKTLQDLAHGFESGSISLGDWRKDLKALPADQAALINQWVTLHNQANGFNDVLKSGSPAAQTYQDALRRVTGDATGLNTALMLTGDNTAYVNNAVKTVAGATTEAGNHVKGWSEIQGTFNQKLSQAKAGMGALGIEIGEKLLPFATKFFGILADGAQFLAKHHTLATILAVALGVLAVAFTVAAVAVWAMNTAVLADPLTWIIMAIIAAVALLAIGIYMLVKHWGAVWGWIKGIALDVWHFLVKVWDAVKDATIAAWDWIFNLLKAYWGFISGFYKAAFHFVVDPIVAAWKWIAKITSEVWDGIVGFFKKWWPLLLVVFMFPIGVLLAIWNHFHKDITAAIQAVWSFILGYFKFVWGLIVDAAKLWWGLFHDFIIKPIQDVWDWLVSAWTAIGKWLGARWQELKALAMVVWGYIHDAIVKPIENVWHNLVDLGVKVVKAVTGFFDDTWNKVKNIGDKFIDIGTNIVMGIVHGVENAGHMLTDKLKNLAGDALKAAKSFLGISSPSKAFSDEVGQWIPHGIAAGVDSAAGVAHNAVKNLAQGLLGGAGDLGVPGVGVGPVSALGGVAGVPADRLTVQVLNGDAPAGTASGGGRIVVENNIDVYLDNKLMQKSQVRTAQRTKLRNGQTLLQ